MHIQLNHILEIYKILPKINCKQCGIPTCLAFAVAVFKEQRFLDACPYLDRHLIRQYKVKVEQQQAVIQQQELLLRQLKNKITQVDFPSSATRLGASLSGGKLNIKCLGRGFVVDQEGNISSACHVIPWVTLPLLDYILSSTGVDLSGTWVPLRELPNGSPRGAMFEMKCKKPLKQIADLNFDLFLAMLFVFGGKEVKTSFNADISLVVHPLPRVPLLICYTKSEDELPSQLNIFFDTTATEHLSMELLYILVSGFIIMLEKIVQRHS